VNGEREFRESLIYDQDMTSSRHYKHCNDCHYHPVVTATAHQVVVTFMYHYSKPEA
jgi:hypothetical protein